MDELFTVKRDERQDNSKSTTLLLLILFALSTLLYHLNYKSAFDDEFMVIVSAQLPLKELLQFSFGNVHPPLYRLLIYGLKFIFNEWNVSFIPVMHFISALAGTFLIIPVFLFCDRYLNRRTAIIASIGVILSPVILDVGQEGRAYSLFCLVAMTSCYFMMDYPQGITTGRRVCYIASTLTGLYLGYWMVFVVLSQWVMLAGGRLKDKWKQVFLTDTEILGCLYLPWFISWIISHLKDPVFHRRVTTLVSPRDYLYKMMHVDIELLTGYIPHHNLHKIILLSILGVSVLMGAFLLWKKNRVLCCSLLVFIIAPQLTGFIDGFVLHSKYISFVIPVIMILGAYGLASLKIVHILPLAMVFIPIQSSMVQYYYRMDVNPYVKQNYRELGVFIKNNLFAGDRVISYGNHWVPNFYMNYPMSHQHYSADGPTFPKDEMVKDIDNPAYKRVWLTFLTFQEKDLKENLYPHIHRDILIRKQCGEGIQVLLLGNLSQATSSKQTNPPR